MKYFVISEEFRAELLQYLGTRPLQEVMKGYNSLLNLPEAVEADNPKETATKHTRPKVVID